MAVPEIFPDDLTAQGSSERRLQLARSICQALSAYPHYVVLKGWPATEDFRHVVNIAHTICSVAVPADEAEAEAIRNQKISFTKVRIDEAKVKAVWGTTTFSRTNQPLDLHSDNPFKAPPEDFVVLQCVVPDRSGGDSIIAPVEDILGRLAEPDIARLREPVFPFGGGTYPIIEGPSGKETIRYYRMHVDRGLERNGRSLSEEHRTALEALEAVLTQTDQFARFRLAAGDIVFMDNRKVLHGRSGFEPTSDRLFYRLRFYADIDSGAQTSEAAPNAADAVTPLLSSARDLIRRRLFDDAGDHLRQALERAPDDVAVLSPIGDLLIETGQFRDALRVFRRCESLNPGHYETNLALSALAFELGEEAVAQDYLRNAGRRRPYEVNKEPDPNKPSILQVRGLEKSTCAVRTKPDGSFMVKLRGGHFSTRDLIRWPLYNLMFFNVLDDNVNLLEVPTFDLVLNTMGCPDMKRASLLALARFVDRHPAVPVINHPRRVLETSRDRNALRLGIIPGVEFPKTERLWWTGESLDQLVNEVAGLGFKFPVIVRRTGTQTGKTVVRLDSEAALREHFQTCDPHSEFYVIQYRDCRTKEGYYNKIRLFCIEGRYYPVANLHHDDWNVHGGDRYSVMDKNQWMQDREQSLLSDPAGYLGKQNIAKLRAIRETIGLDFFGIDMTVLADGTMYVFEANAAMRHTYEHTGVFPYTEPYLRRVSDAFDAMVRNALEWRWQWSGSAWQRCPGEASAAQPAAPEPARDASAEIAELT